MTRDSVHGAPSMASGRLTALAQKVGGLAAVARRVGSPLRVVRKWNYGRVHPGPANIVRLAALAKEYAASLPWDDLTGTAGAGATAGALLPLVVKVGSLREVARRIGVCAGSVSRWNRGNGRPGPRATARLAAFAAAYGLEAPFPPEFRRVPISGRKEPGAPSELRSAVPEDGAGRPAALRRFVRRRAHLPHNGPLNELIVAVGSRSLLARTVGVTDETVGRWNRRRRLPNVRQRRVLAKLANERRMESPFAVDRDAIRDEQRARAQSVLEPLAGKLGSLAAVAGAIGAPLRRVRTWNRGRHMPARAWRERLAELARGQGVDAPFVVEEGEESPCGSDSSPEAWPVARAASSQ